MANLSEIYEEFEFLEADERYRLLIDLGRNLPPMPDAMKTDATLVRGCSASVWVYPLAEDGNLTFLADSNAAITKGIIALVLKTVEGKTAAETAALDIAECVGDGLAVLDGQQFGEFVGVGVDQDEDSPRPKIV